jgi:hypothetical protein
MDSVTSLATQRNTVKRTIQTFSSAFGYTVDTALVSVSASGAMGTGGTVTVSVTNYPVFSGISFIGGLSNITVTRQAIFRCERNCYE